MTCLKIAATSNVQLIVARKGGSRFARSPNFSRENENLRINPKIILHSFTKARHKLKYCCNTIKEE